MNIRKGTERDLDALASLFNAYRVFYGKSTDIEGAKAFLTERMTQQESVIFVAERSSELGNLLGFAQLYPSFSSVRMGRLWVLNDLFVLPHLRNNGIGKQLILASQAFCRQTKACGLVLETAKDNFVGNHLYPAMGFEVDDAFLHYAWNVQ